jgi:farnesyl diphosphate synthase
MVDGEDEDEDHRCRFSLRSASIADAMRPIYISTYSDFTRIKMSDIGSKSQKTAQHQEKAEFLKVFEALRDELVDDPLLGEDQPEQSKHWMKRMLDYNVPHGKLNRGMAVLDAIASLDEGKNTCDEAMKNQARRLGWCIEFLQAYFLVADDIMDHSITRRGQPCWYKQPDIGLIAINDGIILESCIYRVLKNHFSSDTAQYVHLMDLFHEVTHQTSHGQLLDTTTAPIGTVDLSRYTMERYMRIVTYKTAFYTFYLPIACALCLYGIPRDNEAYAIAENICMTMGQYFQIQDDYLDCFGDPETIGKIGTDIEDNKCSWLVVQAMERASEVQKKVIEENYGKTDEACVKKIKDLYNELKLEELFKSYETESYESMVKTIEGQSVVPKGVFMPLLAKIYKRSK